jgi:putative CocE/NonD family hydrolase
LDPSFNSLNELHRFFDYWLKGIDNGIMDEPPIYLATGKTPKNKRWQYASDWPLPDQEQLTYYLGAGPSNTAPSVNDGVLNLTPPSDANAEDDYTSDYSITTNTDWYMGTPRPTGEEIDAKGLTYTTDPLPDDTRIQGHPMVTLWIAADTPDAAFFLTIEDVDENGRSVYVNDGRLKASMRETHEAPFDNLSLPWHRGYAEDARELIPGEPTKLYFDMLPMSYIFKAGHRIRLVITSAVGGWFVNIPTYDPPSRISVLRDAEHPSRITLPVTPDRATVFSGTARVNLSRDKYSYRGAAKLYALGSAVYMLLGERWFHWDTLKLSNIDGEENYLCGKGDDQLKVSINHNKDRVAKAVATGDGVYFNGWSIIDQRTNQD